MHVPWRSAPTARSSSVPGRRATFMRLRPARSKPEQKAGCHRAGLNMPNGVAFRDGALYVAEVNRLLRYDDIESRLNAPPQAAVVNANFPSDKTHGWKFIAFGPDGWLYVPVGAPCNICEPDPNRYANLQRMRVDGGATGSFRPRYSQYRRVRLAPANQTALVHR